MVKDKKNIVEDVLRKAKSEGWHIVKGFLRIFVISIIGLITFTIIVIIIFFDLSKLSIATEIEIIGLILCMLGSLFVLGPLLESIIYNNLFFEILHGENKDLKNILLDKNTIEKENIKTLRISVYSGLIFLTGGFFLQIVSKVV